MSTSDPASAHVEADAKFVAAERGGTVKSSYDETLDDARDACADLGSSFLPFGRLKNSSRVREFNPPAGNSSALITPEGGGPGGGGGGAGGGARSASGTPAISGAGPAGGGGGGPGGLGVGARAAAPAQPAFTVAWAYPALKSPGGAPPGGAGAPARGAPGGAGAPARGTAARGAELTPSVPPSSYSPSSC